MWIRSVSNGHHEAAAVPITLFLAQELDKWERFWDAAAFYEAYHQMVITKANLLCNYMSPEMLY